MAISSIYYFADRPVKFADAVISNFLSPEDNPRGYLAAALGAVIAALVLAPSARLFYRRMRMIHRGASLAGTAFYSAGLLAAILLGCLAPIRGVDFSVHLVLAYAAFISLQAGISIYLTVAAYSTKSRWVATFAAMEWAAATLLISLSLAPDAFRTLSWLESTAFCKWALCATIASGLWVLASSCS